MNTHIHTCVGNNEYSQCRHCAISVVTVEHVKQQVISIPAPNDYLRSIVCNLVHWGYLQAFSSHPAWNNSPNQVINNTWETDIAFQEVEQQLYYNMLHNLHYLKYKLWNVLMVVNICMSYCNCLPRRAAAPPLRMPGTHRRAVSTLPRIRRRRCNYTCLID